MSVKSVIKIILIYLLKVFMYLLHIFPMRNNRIIINSYRGQQYACNPKYISEYLVNNYRGTFEIIWAFNNPYEFDFLLSDGIKLVKYNSIKRFYYEATAKFSINNIGSYSWNPCRRGQQHINTWHGGVDYKKVALGEIKNDKLMKKTLLMSSKETTLFLSANSFFEKRCIPTEFGYYGEILKCGLPRNDDLVNGRDVADIRSQLGIDKNEFVILYAPTWRYDSNEKIPSLDFDVIIRCAEIKTGRKCRIIYRSHHISGVSIENEKKVLDVSEFSDSQLIMQISDMLITDYSSLIWDFSLTKRPCFLYTPDLKKYVEERGFNIPIERWGFDICETSYDICNSIMKYDRELYLQVVEEHHKMLGSYEKGRACELFAEWLLSKL